MRIKSPLRTRELEHHERKNLKRLVSEALKKRKVHSGRSSKNW